jgi:hypothetical protein
MYVYFHFPKLTPKPILSGVPPPRTSVSARYASRTADAVGVGLSVLIRQMADTTPIPHAGQAAPQKASVFIRADKLQTFWQKLPTS